MPSRISVYLGERGTSCCLDSVETLSKLANALLCLVAAALAAWAGISDIAGQGSGPSPAPAPAPGHLHPWSQTTQAYVLIAGGSAVAVTALLGLLAAHNRSLCLLNVHLVLLSVLMAAQLCLVVSLVAQARDDSGHTAIQDTLSDFLAAYSDAPQRFPAAPLTVALGQPDLPTDRVQLARLIMLGIAAGLQCISLALGCLLSSLYGQVEAAAQDWEEEGEGVREAALRRPLMPAPGTTQQATWRRPHSPGARAPDPEAQEWRTRMQERYGLDTTQFTYDPSRGPVPAQEAPPTLESSRQQRACTVM